MSNTKKTDRKNKTNLTVTWLSADKHFTIVDLMSVNKEFIPITLRVRLKNAIDDGTVADELCKIGMRGPGGGLIFFVDYNDQYSGFNYLEAAPASCEATSKVWSSDMTHSLLAVNGWAARAVGSGQANTTAMMANGSTSYVADTSGAAFFADSSTCGTKTDWFLGSLGEMKLMYDNLQGLGSFSTAVYLSSSEYSATSAWAQYFWTGEHGTYAKVNSYYVRPVRSF
jgi:hypothetical protein